jgi:hypothetical protein
MSAELARLTQNCDKTAPSGRELYHLQFSFQAASPETFGYTLVQPFKLRFFFTNLIFYMWLRT